MDKIARVKEQIKLYVPLPKLHRDKGGNPPDVLIQVVTGDQRGAGTDCKVWVILHDDESQCSPPIRLGKRLTTNCRSQTCEFKVSSQISNLKNISVIEFWLEKFGVGEAWFVKYFAVTILAENITTIFPIHRWVDPTLPHQLFLPYDCCLPQNTPELVFNQRWDELVKNRSEYTYKQRVKHGPSQVIT